MNQEIRKRIIECCDLVQYIEMRSSDIFLNEVNLQKNIYPLLEALIPELMEVLFGIHTNVETEQPRKKSKTEVRFDALITATWQRRVQGLDNSQSVGHVTEKVQVAVEYKSVSDKKISQKYTEKEMPSRMGKLDITKDSVPVGVVYNVSGNLNSVAVNWNASKSNHDRMGQKIMVECTNVEDATREQDPEPSQWGGVARDTISNDTTVEMINNVCLSLVHAALHTYGMSVRVPDSVINTLRFILKSPAYRNSLTVSIAALQQDFTVLPSDAQIASEVFTLHSVCIRNTRVEDINDEKQCILIVVDEEDEEYTVNWKAVRAHVMGEGAQNKWNKELHRWRESIMDIYQTTVDTYTVTHDPVGNCSECNASILAMATPALQGTNLTDAIDRLHCTNTWSSVVIQPTPYKPIRRRPAHKKIREEFYDNVMPSELLFATTLIMFNVIESVMYENEWDVSFTLDPSPETKEYYLRWSVLSKMWNMDGKWVRALEVWRAQISMVFSVNTSQCMVVFKEANMCAVCPYEMVGEALFNEKKCTFQIHPAAPPEAMVASVAAPMIDPDRAIGFVDQGVAGRPVDIGVGLVNYGATCWLNALLQCMLYTPNFEMYLFTTGLTPTPVLDALRDFFTLVKTHQHCVIGAAGMYRSMRTIDPLLQSDVAQDAHEWFGHVINALTSELIQNPIAIHLLKFSEKKVLQCNTVNCNRISSNTSAMYGLNVPIDTHGTLEEALRAYTTPTMSDSFNCEECKKRDSTTECTKFGKLPPVLVINIKRIVFNRTPITTAFSFPADLRMEEFCWSDTLNNETNYTLYGVVSWCNYHYVAYCKVGAQWVCFNDSVATVMTQDDVLEQCLNTAYVMFYTLNTQPTDQDPGAMIVDDSPMHGTPDIPSDSQLPSQQQQRVANPPSPSPVNPTDGSQQQKWVDNQHRLSHASLADESYQSSGPPADDVMELRLDDDRLKNLTRELKECREELDQVKNAKEWDRRHNKRSRRKKEQTIKRKNQPQQDNDDNLTTGEEPQSSTHEHMLQEDNEDSSTDEGRLSPILAGRDPRHPEPEHAQSTGKRHASDPQSTGKRPMLHPAQTFVKPDDATEEAQVSPAARAVSPLYGRGYTRGDRYVNGEWMNATDAKKMKRKIAREKKKERDATDKKILLALAQIRERQRIAELGGNPLGAQWVP